MDAIHKILVPTDFSAHADEAFRVAHTLARAMGADVILFHVAQPPAIVSEGGKLLASSGKEEEANLWDRFQRILSALDLTFGTPYRELIRSFQQSVHLRLCPVHRGLGRPDILLGTFDHGRVGSAKKLVPVRLHLLQRQASIVNGALCVASL